jgi:hypothetical protein
MKKITLSKETMRVLTDEESAQIAGGDGDKARREPKAGTGGPRDDNNTRTPCDTFPVAVCVTGRC